MGYRDNMVDVPDLARLGALLNKDNRTVVATPDPADADKVYVGTGLIPTDATGLVQTREKDGTETPTTVATDDIATLSASLDADKVAGGVRVQVVKSTELDGLRVGFVVPNPGQVGGGKGGMKPIQYDDNTGQPKRIGMLLNAWNMPLKKDGTIAEKSEVTDANAVIQLDGTEVDPTWDGSLILGSGSATAGKPAQSYADTEFEGKHIGPVYNWAQVNRYDEGEDGDLAERRTGPVGVYDVEPRQTALYAPFVGWTAQMTPRADAT